MRKSQALKQLIIYGVHRQRDIISVCTNLKMDAPSNGTWHDGLIFSLCCTFLLSYRYCSLSCQDVKVVFQSSSRSSVGMSSNCKRQPNRQKDWLTRGSYTAVWWCVYSSSSCRPQRQPDPGTGPTGRPSETWRLPYVQFKAWQLTCTVQSIATWTSHMLVPLFFYQDLQALSSYFCLLVFDCRNSQLCGYTSFCHCSAAVSQIASFS